MLAKSLCTLVAAVAALAVPGAALSHPAGAAAAAAKRGVVHPSADAQPWISDIALKELAMMADSERLSTSYDYDHMLAFARCVSKFDPDAAWRVMQDPIGSPADETALTRLGEVNRACLVQRARVHPLLLRAALAEAAMDGGEVRQPLAEAVGVPAVAKGIRIGAISLCQNSQSRDLVSAVLATRPGSEEERAAVERLYSTGVVCGPKTLGGISPTVARMALVEARYRAAGSAR